MWIFYNMSKVNSKKFLKMLSMKTLNKNIVTYVIILLVAQDNAGEAMADPAT